MSYVMRDMHSIDLSNAGKNYRSFDQIFSKSENTFSLTAIKFSPVGISYWCNTSFDAESRAEYDPRGYISIGVIFEIL